MVELRLKPETCTEIPLELLDELAIFILSLLLIFATPATHAKIPV